MKGLTVSELKHLYLRKEDLVKIVVGGKLAYSGWSFLIPWKFMECTVKSFRSENEIRRKDWREAGLWPPMNPEAVAHVRLADADIRQYYVLTLE